MWMRAPRWCDVIRDAAVCVGRTLLPPPLIQRW